MWAERRGGRCPGSAVTLLLRREMGYGPRRPTHALAFERVGEDRAAHYELEETKCNLPPSVRSTFLMAFSPDCTKVASTHGDHRIHVCEVATGRLAHTLEGHPRTPWCLAFHPTSNDILASGCLAGQVRVWDLRGGSEVWSSREGTVISSLAFHPLESLLAIATANRVVLWDWRKGHALATCKTASEREKVRFVQFCSPRGDSLVTGITNVDLGGPGAPRVLDPLLGPQVGALRVPAGPVDTGSSQRRSILTRLMSMYQHLEGLEEMVAPTLEPEPEEALHQARSYARDVTSYSTNLQRLNQLYQQQMQHALTTQGAGPQGGAEDGSSADDEAGLSPESSGSASAAATGPNSRYFWATFYRLRSICSRLERRMQQHQLRSQTPSSSSSLPSAMTGRRSGRPPRLRLWTPSRFFGRDGRSRPVPSRSATAAGTSGGHRAAAASSRAPSSSSAGPSLSSATSSSSGRPPPALGHPDVSVSLVSLLARLQMSLQSLSSAALTTAVAREQIHQVRVRITEILERLSNVSGYRARLTSLREEIFEAAAAEERHPLTATRGGGEPQLEEPGEEDATPSQHWDLAYCLWLVEMSLQLTRQMQRILAADYRLTQLHLNATSSSTASATTTTTTATPSSSSSPPPLFSAFSTQVGRTRHPSPPRTPPGTSSAASTSRSRGSPPAMRATLSTPPSARRSVECPRLRRHALRRRFRPFLRSSPEPQGSSSTSSDSMESSDEDDVDLRRMRDEPSPDEDYPTPIPAVFGGIGRNRFPLASPPELEEDPSLPEVHVSPPSSPPLVRPTAPVPPRPRSPPLPVILAGASRGGVAASLDSLWGPPVPSAAYFSLLYDGGFRPRLSVYETGPNLTHRIQCWDMTGTKLPDIGDAKACLVAPRCKIHNDSSVALGGNLLAALVPCGLLGASLCVYSLRPRGTLLHTWSFGANAISVSLSPMARYLVVGFAATRGYFTQEREVVAQIFKLTPPDTDTSSSTSGGGQLQQVGNLSQPGGIIGQPPISLNSVRWLPRPGEGLIYGTNRGSLCICRPLKPISKEDGGGRPTSRSGPTRDATSPFVMLTDQVDRTARNTTIQVLSTASQTALPQTQTTGTQTMLRGSGGLFVEQEQPIDDSLAAASSAVSSPSSETSDGHSAGASTSGASSSSEASSAGWYSSC